MPVGSNGLKSMAQRLGWQGGQAALQGPEHCALAKAVAWTADTVRVERPDRPAASNNVQMSVAIPRAVGFRILY